MKQANAKIRAGWSVVCIGASGEVKLYYENRKSVEELKFTDITQFGNAVRSNKFKFSQLILALPKEICIVKSIKLPTDDFEEAAKMADFEIEEIMPLGKDTFVYSIMPVEKNDKGYYVSVYIVLKSDLDAVFSQFENAGLIIDRVIIDPGLIRKSSGGYESFESLPTLMKDDSFKNFNLLLPEKLAEIEKKQLLGRAVVLGITVFVFGLLIWLVFFFLNLRFERSRDYFLSQIEPVKYIAVDIDTKKHQIHAIEKHSADKGVIMGIMSELYKFTPKGISVDNLKVMRTDSQMKLTIKGRAEKLSNAFGYTEAVRESKILKSLNIENAQQIPVPGGKSVVEFRAECLVGNIK